MIPTERPEQKNRRELSKIDTVNPFWTVSRSAPFSILIKSTVRPFQQCSNTSLAGGVRMF